MADDIHDAAICAELQQEEQQVLEVDDHIIFEAFRLKVIRQAIYPECISSDISRGVHKFNIQVELGDQVTVVLCKDSGAIPQDQLCASANGFEPNTRSLTLSSLPPIFLEFVLPPTYPLHLPPQILSLHITRTWFLGQTQLRQKLLQMWQPGEGVLYNWVEWLRSAEFLKDMGHFSQVNKKGVVTILHPQPHLLSQFLSAHDAQAQQSLFSLNSYPCGVCLTSRKGSRCLKLSCGHVFCRDCLEDGWKLYIAEGDVGRVACLDPACVKDARQANEDEVRRVVTEDEVQRWKWLSAKRMFDQDPTVVHCPMDLCQAPVPKPTDLEEDGSGWERLRTCASCNYSFCSFCRRTWHGTLSECPIPQSEKFLDEYMQLPEGSSGRKMLEQRYGARNLARMVVRFQEEQANREWLRSSTMACPNCNIHVEKSAGCNHMTCGRCKTHFCYRCGMRLDGNKPYAHFSTAGLPCYQKLFDVETVEDEWQPMGLFEWV
ncbi:RWD-domain-containing protein [Amylostereum chailletii]|nr:RWD-domain-containing protein [Amylostereum chailletii]